MFTLGENIKKLRREKDMTQETLASLLHISPQAVSRWETNITSPDAILLPKLAYIFGCTTDSLLGVSDFNREEKFSEYSDRAGKALYKGEGEKAVEIWREALEEMPGDYGVMVELAGTMRFIASASTDEGLKMFAEAKDMYEIILDRCTDTDTINTARAALPFVYKVLGEVDKAKELVEKLPGIYYSKEIAQKLIAVTTDEKFSAVMAILTTSLALFTDELTYLETKESPLTDDDRFEMMKKHEAIEKIVFDGETREMSIDLMRRISIEFAKRGEYEEAFKRLRNAAEISKWRDNSDYNSGTYSRIRNAVPFRYQGKTVTTVLSASAYTYCGEIAETLENKVFDAVRNTPEFKEITGILNQ